MYSQLRKLDKEKEKAKAKEKEQEKELKQKAQADDVQLASQIGKEKEMTQTELHLML